MDTPLREPLLSRPHRYRMVIGVDLSDYADIVIEHALDQAARHAAPDLHFLVVKENKKDSSEELQQKLTERVAPMLETFNQHGTKWRARMHVRAGKVEEQLIGMAADLRADMLVIGSFGLHNSGHSVKNVPSQILLDAPCPTLVVTMPPEQDASPHCAYCDAVREDSDGGTMFCATHAGNRKFDPTDVDGPATEWTGGAMMWGNDELNPG